MTMVMTMKALGGVLFSGSYTFLLAACHALLDSYLINLSFMQNFILYHMSPQITDKIIQAKENQCIQQVFFYNRHKSHSHEVVKNISINLSLNVQQC